MIDTLYESFNGSVGNWNFKEIIKDSTDSVAISGVANLAMIKKRRGNIKPEIPVNLQKICSKEVSFSPILFQG